MRRSGIFFRGQRPETGDRSFGDQGAIFDPRSSIFDLLRAGGVAEFGGAAAGVEAEFFGGWGDDALAGGGVEVGAQACLQGFFDPAVFA